MIAAVHIADVRPDRAVSTLRRTPKPKQVAGLRSAFTALAAPLRSSLLPAPTLRRVAMVSFWDDDASVESFEQSDAFPAAFADAFRARAEPLRAYGSWPGLDPEVPRTRKVDYDGPALVLTLGRLRVSQAIRFLRASARAEAAVLEADGLVWATGLGRPPLVATCSLWKDSSAIAHYAFEPADGAHASAIAEGRQKPFHKQEAFVRFRPYAISGSLHGKNPLAADELAEFSASSG